MVDKDEEEEGVSVECLQEKAEVRLWLCRKCKPHWYQHKDQDNHKDNDKKKDKDKKKDQDNRKDNDKKEGESKTKDILTVVAEVSWLWNVPEINEGI